MNREAQIAAVEWALKIARGELFCAGCSELDLALKAEAISELLESLRSEGEPVAHTGVVIVCPERDCDCGDFEKNWCATCPKRKRINPAHADWR